MREGEERETEREREGGRRERERERERCVSRLLAIMLIITGQALNALQLFFRHT